MRLLSFGIGLLSLILSCGVADADPIFTCKGSDYTKAVLERKTWMALCAAQPHSYLCIDTREKDYRIVPCETLLQPEDDWKPSCYENMKEAMLRMDIYLKMYHDGEITAGKHWERVMKECVR